MPKGDFGGKRNTNGFDRNPGNAGRKPRLFQQMKNKGYSKDDVRGCYAALADCTKDELSEIVNNEKATALEISIARAYMKSMAKGDYRLIKDIIETFADKPKQHTDLTSSDRSVKGIDMGTIFDTLRDKGKVDA